MKKIFTLAKIVCAMGMLVIILPAQAQTWGGGISKKAQQQLIEKEKAAHRTVFVNTNAPGVHKEYDKDRGAFVWRNGMGSYICLDENMRPMKDMDKEVYYTGQNNNPDDPKAPKDWVEKVWDEERGCYVWRDKASGGFLGRDKPSIDKQKEWLAKKEQEKKTQANAGGKSRDAEDEEDYIEAGGYGEVPDDFDPRKLQIQSDEGLRQAEAALAEAKSAIRMAESQGVNVGEYVDLGVINILEQKINEYKRKRNR